MIDFDAVLKKNLYGIFATVDDGRPRTRAFQYLFSDGKKVYFGTTNNKPVYQQMIKVPYISFCTHSQDYSEILSINGKVEFVDSIDLKTRAMDEYPAIKELYKTPENPIFEIFYVDVDEVETFNFNEGSRKYRIE
ncbi:TPA: pyridoxamine 5'-phosphate oxidase family protein [Streptococcus agalactiae]|jgi:hypothetical protein|nr:pyridoxamine 5'-phosphate oxidase family protein [Streptococcus agalactiae]HEO5790368.1 pyridoxamine 5'-phosphate oxidase family protein [Streptococcus agalactiae]